MLTSNMDRILIVKYFGLAVLPLYSMAKRVLTLGHRFISGFTDYLFPLLSGQSIQNRSAMLRKLEYPLPWCLFGLGTLVYGTAIILGPLLLNYLVGNDFGSQALIGIIGFSLVGMSYSSGVLPYHAARADGRTYLNTYGAMAIALITFSSIWLFANQRNFSATIFCQASGWPVVLIYYRFVIGNKSWGESLKHQLQPALGFTSVWALIVLGYLASGGVSSGWLHSLIFEGLLLSGIGMVVVFQVYFGKNQEIRRLFESLLKQLAKVTGYKSTLKG